MRDIRQHLGEKERGRERKEELSFETYTGVRLETRVTIAGEPAAAVVHILIEIITPLPFQSLAFECGNPYSNIFGHLTQPLRGSMQRALVDPKSVTPCAP